MSVVYVNFFSPITEESANKFMAACVNIMRIEKPKAVHFLFASSGGNVDAGIAIYNYLRSLPMKIIMHNNGSINSISNVIFHAADERSATPHATFFFHGVTVPPPTTDLNRARLHELLKQIDVLESKMSTILSERCRLTSSELRDLFTSGESKDTQFALDKGLIQSVREVSIPADAKVYSLLLS